MNRPQNQEEIVREALPQIAPASSLALATTALHYQIFNIQNLEKFMEEVGGQG